MFKKIGIVFFSLFAILLFFEVVLRLYAAWYKHSLTQLYKNENKNTKYKLKILAVGESTTAGLWVENRSYPIQLKEKMEKYYKCRDCVEINIVDLPGGNSSITLELLPAYLVRLKPNIVIFMEGYNDFAFYEYNIDAILLENFFTKNKLVYAVYLNTVELLNEIRVFRVAKLAYVSLTMPRWIYLDARVRANEGRISTGRIQFNTNQKNKQFIERQMEKNMEKMVDIARINNVVPVLMTYHLGGINTIIRTVAHNKKAFLVDNEAVFANLPHFADYIFKESPSHPNEKGYEIIAQNILNHLINWSIVKP
jgi:lysophospholipase L1-like esterase